MNKTTQRLLDTLGENAYLRLYSMYPRVKSKLGWYVFEWELRDEQCMGVLGGSISADVI